MTRLIDADEIRWVDHYDADGNLVKKYKVAYSDEMPPTVDAIPVEWMRKFKDAEVTEASAKLFDECKGDFVEWMIAEWLIYSQYVEGEKKEE